MSEASPFEPSLIGAIWRDRVLVACIVVAFLVVAVAYAVTRPVTYTATASVLVEDPRQQGADPAERFVADQAAVFRSANVAREAARLDRAVSPSPGLSTEDFLHGMSIAVSARDSNLVRVSMSAASARAALVGADNVVNAYRNVVRANAENRVKAPMEQTDAQLSALAAERSTVEDQIGETPPPTGAVLQGLEQRLTQILDRQNTLELAREALVAEVSASTQTVALYSPPTRATKSSFKDSAKTLVLAVLLGGMLGSAVAYTRSTRRPAFFKPHEPELALGAPLLAEIPSFSNRSARALPVIEQPASAAAHAFRYAGAAVEIQRAAAGARCLAVTSARRGEGRTVSVANLGLALAASGVETLVVDGDLESRGLTRQLRGSMPMSQGWLDLLAGHALLAGVVAPVPVAHGAATLGLLAAGEDRPSAAEFFGSDKFRPLFEVLLGELRDRYDIVLIDVPALLEVTYTATLASCADAVITVVDHGGSVKDQEEVVRRLRLIGPPLVGYLYDHVPRLRGSARSSPSWSLPPHADARPSPVEWASPSPKSVAMTAMSPPAEPAVQALPRPAPVPDVGMSWRCRCGSVNVVALERCPRCGRSQVQGRSHRAQG